MKGCLYEIYPATGEATILGALGVRLDLLPCTGRRGGSSRRADPCAALSVPGILSMRRWELLHLGCWIRNVMDADSRFLRTPRVSQTRSVEDTDVLFLKSQECPTAHMQQYRGEHGTSFYESYQYQRR